MAPANSFARGPRSCAEGPVSGGDQCRSPKLTSDFMLQRYFPIREVITTGPKPR